MRIMYTEDFLEFPHNSESRAFPFPPKKTNEKILHPH